MGCVSKTGGRIRESGDDAFRELVEPYRPELRVHCYRMLGSFTEAEDVVQETMLAAWRGLNDFEERASLRTWLYRIATNRCLNAMRDARRRPAQPVPPFHPPEPSRRAEVTWLQPYPDSCLHEIVDKSPGPEARYDSKEAVELAFVAGLQALPPRQAAVVVLRDVLGFPAADVAEMLDTSETAVKGVLQRARATLEQHRPTGHRNRRQSRESLQERDLVRRFAAAFTSGDVDGVVALLTDDAWLAMPPAPHEYHGTKAIRAFLDASTGWRGRYVAWALPTRANAQPAFAWYLAEAGGEVGYPAGLVVLTLVDDGVSAVTHFLDVDVFDHFGLPESASVPDYARLTAENRAHTPSESQSMH